MRSIFLLTLCATGCLGGLENEPFLPGKGGVEGTLAPPIDPERAFVAVLGLEALTASVALDGRFRLENVPSGTQRLAMSTGHGMTAISSVEVFAARTIRAEVELSPAPQIKGRVVLEEAFIDGHPSQVRVEDLPIAIDTDAAGNFAFDAVPELCVHLSAQHLGFVAATSTACPGGAPFVARLRQASTHAAELCAPCSSADQCHGGLCIQYGEERLCSQLCDGHLHLCPQGFACVTVGSGESACVVQDRSCTALADFDRRVACSSPEACGIPAVNDGVCDPVGTCTLRCVDDHGCPSGSHCLDGGNGLICR